MDPGSDPAQARGELLGATDLTAASSTPLEQSSPLPVPGRAPRRTPRRAALCRAPARGGDDEGPRGRAAAAAEHCRHVQAARTLDRLRVNGESAAGTRASGDGAVAKRMTPLAAALRLLFLGEGVSIPPPAGRCRARPGARGAAEEARGNAGADRVDVRARAD